MIIKTYKEITLDLAKDVYKLSELMEDSGEFKKHIFAFTIILTENNFGEFFIGCNGDKKVSYGLLSYGVDDNKFRRILYMAVDRQFRKQGYGKATIRKIIEQEVDLSSGCSLTCQNSLQNFYESIGFKFVTRAKMTNHNNLVDEVSLAMAEEGIDIHSPLFGNFYNIAFDDDKALKTYKQLEKKYNVVLL